LLQETLSILGVKDGDLASLCSVAESLKNAYEDAAGQLASHGEGARSRALQNIELHEENRALKARLSSLRGTLMAAEEDCENKSRRIVEVERQLSSLQSQEAPERAWERGFRTAQRMAASLCPWREHLARNPIAATLSSPGQCVEVKNQLILAQSVYPYVAPQESVEDGE
jgi:septal ring factor EnvC (AmiA/AmiB activator)